MYPYTKEQLQQVMSDLCKFVHDVTGNPNKATPESVLGLPDVTDAIIRIAESFEYGVG